MNGYDDEWRGFHLQMGEPSHAPMWAELDQLADLLQAIGSTSRLGFFAATFPGNPLPQARARSGQGRHYTPAKTRAAQNLLRSYFAERIGDRPPMAGNLAIACIFYREKRLKVDGDNLMKLVLDAGTKVLWHDDSQITGGAFRIELDRRNPRTVIGLAPQHSTLRRDLVRVK